MMSSSKRNSNFLRQWFRPFIFGIAFIPLWLLVCGDALADWQSDRGWKAQWVGTHTARLRKVYPARTPNNNARLGARCIHQSIEACIKTYGEPAERRQLAQGDEMLVYFGTKQLYRGTAQSNQSIGPEWSEHIAKNGRIVSEFQIVQVVEVGIFWAPEGQGCEDFGTVWSNLCRDELTALGPIPESSVIEGVPSTMSVDQVGRLYDALVHKSICEAHEPGMAARASQAYSTARAKYPKLVDSIEGSQEYRDDQASMLKHIQSFPPDQRQSFPAFCEYQITGLGGAGIADARLASPKATWTLFVASLRSGDRDTATACMTFDMRAKFRKVFEMMSLSELKSMVETFKSFALSERYGSFQETLVVRQDGHAGIVVFLLSEGEWKISEM
jgi:hypothetical protein